MQLPCDEGFFSAAEAVKCTPCTAGKIRTGVIQSNWGPTVKSNWGPRDADPVVLGEAHYPVIDNHCPGTIQKC